MFEFGFAAFEDSLACSTRLSSGWLTVKQNPIFYNACVPVGLFRFHFMLVPASHGSCRSVQVCAGAEARFGRLVQLLYYFPSERLERSGPACVAMSGLCQFRFIPNHAGSVSYQFVQGRA